MSFAQTATHSHDMMLTVAITSMKYLGTYAHSVAGNQISRREALSVGVVNAELR